LTPKPLRSRLWPSLTRFWQRDESLTLLLALLLVVAFVLPPLAPEAGRGGALATAFFSLVLLAGISTVLRNRTWAGRTLIALCVVALSLRWLARISPRLDHEVWSAASGTLALATLAVLVLGMVLRPGTVTRRRLEGAVAAYLLFGLAWASAYEWVALRNPSAFGGAIGAGGQPWVYYSLVTLTTMGYGDITPIDPVARSLAVAEAFTGQLYLAILISRLVALELQSRPAE